MHTIQIRAKKCCAILVQI